MSTALSFLLSIAAFNALLKTLEEPPEHVKFVFATTEVQKVLPTVISRCQRFDLRRISLMDLTERLALIAESESVEIVCSVMRLPQRVAGPVCSNQAQNLDNLV